MTRYKLKEDLIEDEEVIEVTEEDADSSSEKLAWEELLRKPHTYPYPYAPYYITDYYPEYEYPKKQYPEGQTPKHYYLCTLEGFLTTSPAIFARHLGEHNTEDAYAFLKHTAAQAIEARLRKRSPNEYLNPESIQKWAAQDLEREFFNSKEAPIDIAKYVSLDTDAMRRFLMKESDICPVCHMIATAIPIQKQSLYAETLSALRKFNPEMCSKSAKKAVQHTFPAQWEDEKISLHLEPLLHAYCAHKKDILKLTALGTLTGTIVEWLFKKELETLSQKKKTFVGLSKQEAKDHPLMKWLKENKEHRNAEG
jgi:hypothetical protein